MEGSSQSAEPEEDLYTRLKTLQRQLEFYEIQVSSTVPLICLRTAVHSLVALLL